MLILLKTLGCKANRYESDKLVCALKKKHEVLESGHPRFRTKNIDSLLPDILVVNTCTVTQVADRKSRQAIYGIKHLYPDCKVIVFGCGSNVSSEEYKKLEGVDFVAKDVKEVLEIVEGLESRHPRFSRGSVGGGGTNDTSRTRALLKIQDGCNNFCSYCIIPRARGPENSFPSRELIKEAQHLEKQGYKEIVLTGINIGEWGEDIDSRRSLCRVRCGNDNEKRGNDRLNIADLIELLIQKTKSVHFRVSSIEPKNFSPKFYKLFKTGRLCTHMHIALQSGCDSVLKRMRRNYCTKEFFDICEKFKKAIPDIGLTTDVIVGFPGETEKEFEKTCKFVQKIGFLKIHIFPYSKRKNTPAYYMKDQISESTKKLRAEKLRKIAEKMTSDFIKKLLGKTYEVLVENPRGNFYKGFTSNYIPVKFSRNTSPDTSRSKSLAKKRISITLKSLQKDGTVLGEISNQPNRK
ncbi:MAG: tRNA (N(6)-L-threonylcarbamoyladenosine(37)-C(2))-methylthiotransferase MtaB [Candidatus Gracilibacteria bacterium]|nr:tRNA (N(6)-L-threonylcarbamoyladenosine(37)-C(2))-methylthiotransferase MtaB [Candidatus Gracilibacteria bacterium]